MLETDAVDMLTHPLSASANQKLWFAALYFLFRLADDSMERHRGWILTHTEGVTPQARNLVLNEKYIKGECFLLTGIS